MATDVSKKNPYAKAYNYRDINFVGISVPNNTTAACTASDIGKSVFPTSGVGWRVASADRPVVGFLVDIDPDNVLTVAVEGIHLATMASATAAAAGDVLEADGNGGVRADNTNAKHGALCIATYDSTHCWVKLR